MRRIMAIDPGLGGTGWALFAGSRPLAWGTLHGGAGTWEERQDAICDGFKRLPKFDACYVELPFFAPSKLVVAKSGALVKLAILTGRLRQCAEGRVEFVAVAVWKGQTPKKITDERLAKRMGRETGLAISEHARDALGIGFYVVEKGEK